MLVKDYWILMILVCILQLHNKEVLVKKKNKKFLINFKNCKGFRSSINKNLWETLSNYKRKVFKQIKLLIQWQKRKLWLHQALHNEKVPIFPWEVIVKMWITNKRFDNFRRNYLENEIFLIFSFLDIILNRWSLINKSRLNV